MDIKRNCALSPLIDNNRRLISTPSNRPPPNLRLGSNASTIHAIDFTPEIDEQTTKKSDLLDEQFRLERAIANESSIKTEDSFKTTYTSLQTILSQMQVKLASVFLQETEYLKEREQRLEQDEKNLIKQKDFSELQHRLETAVIHVTQFQTDGEQILRTLFAESRQIDEDLSNLICESLASLARSRTIIQEKIQDFSEKSDQIQSELNDRQILIRNSQLSITLLLDFVNTLNQLNIDHSQDLTITINDFEKQYQQFNQISQISNNHINITKEIEQIRLLENEKRHLEQELLDQTLLLDNIYTILGKAINN